MAGKRIGEKIKNIVTWRAATSAVAGLACTAALAACDSTVSVENASIKPCDIQPYDKKTGNQPIDSSDEFMSTAETDVLTLQRRALEDGGSISLDDNTITATSSRLAMDIPRGNIAGDVDHVIFLIGHGSVQMKAGYVACSDAGELYLNGTYETLQADVKATSGLH